MFNLELTLLVEVMAIPDPVSIPDLMAILDPVAIPDLMAIPDP